MKFLNDHSLRSPNRWAWHFSFIAVVVLIIFAFDIFCWFSPRPLEEARETARLKEFFPIEKVIYFNWAFAESEHSFYRNKLYSGPEAEQNKEAITAFLTFLQKANYWYQSDQISEIGRFSLTLEDGNIVAGVFNQNLLQWRSGPFQLMTTSIAGNQFFLQGRFLFDQQNVEWCHGLAQKIELGQGISFYRKHNDWYSGQLHTPLPSGVKNKIDQWLRDNCFLQVKRFIDIRLIDKVRFSPLVSVSFSVDRKIDFDWNENNKWLRLKGRIFVVDNKNIFAQLADLRKSLSVFGIDKDLVDRLKSN